MPETPLAQRVLDQIETENPNNTQVRALAAKAGKNQAAALQVWQHGGRKQRMAAVLMLEPRQTTPDLVDQLLTEVEKGPQADHETVGDWLLANMILKKPALLAAAGSWVAHPSPLRRRLFWTSIARTAKDTPAEVLEPLLARLEAEMEGAPAMVQWTMNWAAAHIGIYHPGLRPRCLALGTRLGLYINYPTPKGCTSPYLPTWIEAIVARGEPA